MPKYDASYHPPAPTALVTLHDVNSGASLAGVPMLLDLGADVTLLPRAAVERLGIAPEADLSFELMGFDGTRSFASAVTLQLIFLRRAFRGHYLLIDGESGILGRDILNHLVLLFDGPGQEWSQHAL